MERSWDMVVVAAAGWVTVINGIVEEGLVETVTFE